MLFFLFLMKMPYDGINPVRDYIFVEKANPPLYKPRRGETQNINPMANTFTQIYIQSVFAVQNRQSLIEPNWKADLYKYITGIVTNQGHKLIAINGMPDHIHLFFGLNPTQSISNLLQDIKGSSSKWINENKLVQGKFEWQSGYGAFSYSRNQIDKVVKYIENQEEHHQKHTFIEEYKAFLKIFEIEYDERYIFKAI